MVSQPLHVVDSDGGTDGGVHLTSGHSDTFLKRVEATDVPAAVRDAILPLQAMIRELNIQIAAADQHITQTAETDPIMRRLMTVPGVGPVTAAVLMGHMPELGTLSRQAVASLAGLAPFNQDSGPQRGQRHIRGGRRVIRTALYMATLSALRCNPVIAEDFGRMTEAGKPYKVAMTACMRKLLIILNALVRDNMLWGEKPPRTTPPTP